MSGIPEGIPPVENSWPPPPTLPPPKPLHPQLFILRLPVWGVVLMDMGLGLGEAAVNCGDRWFRHHTFQWLDPAIEGIVAFAGFLVLHLCLRSVLFKNDLRERAEQEAAE